MNTAAYWIVPVAIILASTLTGWIVERLAVRWANSITRYRHHGQKSQFGKALRGHITFWGFLLGVWLTYETLLATSSAQSMVGQALNAAPLNWIPNIAATLFVISASFMAARIVTIIITTSAATTSRPAVSLVTNVTRVAVLAMGFLTVLSIYHINLTPALAAVGVAGLAVSLALQATLTDLLSGMLLLGSHQIEPGQYVKLNSGEEGYVTDITWRTTTIRQLSNNLILVPNSKMTSTSILNYHMPETKGSILVNVGIDYNSDLEFVERVTIEVARDIMRTVTGGVEDFEPFIRYNNLGDFSIQFTVIMQGHQFTDQYLIKHEFIKRLYARYRQEGINIPFPIQTVQLHDATLTAQLSAPAAADGVNGVNGVNGGLGVSGVGAANTAPNGAAYASADSSAASSR